MERDDRLSLPWLFLCWALTTLILLSIGWHLLGLIFLPEATANDCNWPFGSNLVDRAWESQASWITFTLLSIPISVGSIAGTISAYRRLKRGEWEGVIILAIITLLLFAWSSYGWDWPFRTS